MTFAIDSETNGLDIRHGARPFFITICDLEGNQHYWEWEVDPTTREVLFSQEDLNEIKVRVQRIVNWHKMGSSDDHYIVMQNGKFDTLALSYTPGWDIKWPWKMTHDTLIAAHLLCSNRPHNLTALARDYLGYDIRPYELALEKAVHKARSICRSRYKDWKIASEGQAEMPSAKGGKKKSRSGDIDKVWKFDTWLPRAIALEEPVIHPLPDQSCPHKWDEITNLCRKCNGHRWHCVLSEYSNTDSSTTMALWPVMRDELHRRGLWEIYLDGIKLVPIIQDMETRGVTLNGKVLKDRVDEFKLESQRAEQICLNIANSYGYDIEIPRGSRNDSLTDFIFDGLKLKSNKLTDGGNPSMDKHVLEYWQNTLPPNSKQLLFVNSLMEKRARDTAIGYMTSYRKFWLPVDPSSDIPAVYQISPTDRYRLHPSFNQTGTDTLRMSCQNPNIQQISKQEKLNIRECFGPLPGRFWVSMDAQNLELRIPAYEAGETDLINVFEHPKDPPYYGSYHLVVFDLFYPELFKQYGKECKVLYESTYYQWIKNGNFAMIYGCQKAKADQTYHIEGAYEMIRYRFPKITALSNKMIHLANKNGWVETIPDRLINPKKGYPIWCSRLDSGKVMPTEPLNYHVQSTACWIVRRAMVKCHDYLQAHPDHYMIMNVHDELDFDFPLPARASDSEKPWEEKLPIIRELQRLMESCGDDVGIPTPSTVEVHLENWAKGVAI